MIKSTRSQSDIFEYSIHIHYLIHIKYSSNVSIFYIEYSTVFDNHLGPEVNTYHFPRIHFMLVIAMNTDKCLQLHDMLMLTHLSEHRSKY